MVAGQLGCSTRCRANNNSSFQLLRICTLSLQCVCTHWMIDCAVISWVQQVLEYLAYCMHNFA